MPISRSEATAPNPSMPTSHQAESCRVQISDVFSLAVIKGATRRPKGDWCID